MGESCFSRWFMGESDFQGGLWKNLFSMWFMEELIFKVVYGRI